MIRICETKFKGATTQMKALDEYIPMFTLLLNPVHFLAITKPKGVTTRRKALDGHILNNGTACLITHGRKFISLRRKPKGVTTQMKALDEYIITYVSNFDSGRFGTPLPARGVADRLVSVGLGEIAEYIFTD